MRKIVGFLFFLIFLLICNIIAYWLSEDYRFFLKKIKYPEEIVYTTSPINDDNKLEVIEKISKNREEWEKQEASVYTSKESFTFLDALSWKNIISRNKEEIPKLQESEEKILKLFSDFKLQEVEEKSSLFDITTEYPDPYYEFSTRDISFYIFPTKSYSEVKAIFNILSFELPYTLNEVNNFGDASFYINLDTQNDDKTVRFVFESEKRAFWLKIKKDRYNTVKKILKSWGL